MKALIVGYYNHSNFGDDMFQLSFPSVLNQAKRVDFVNIDELETKDWRNYDLVVLGGGDIMCPYFLNKFKSWHRKTEPKIPCHAYSFGMPFLSILEEGHLDIFDYFICRNKGDAQILKKRFGDDYVEYLPDFVFNHIEIDNRTKLKSSKPIVSIFPASQCYQQATILKLGQFIQKYQDFYTFIAYPMDTNQTNSNNDLKLSQKIQEQVPALQIHPGPYNLESIMTLLHSSYYSICTRLHSHILSIMTGTPFISIYSTRKVRNLLDDFKLNEMGTPMFLECQYCHQVNQPPKSQSLVLKQDDHKHKLLGCPACRQMCGTPVDLNLEDLLNLHQKIIQNRRKISEHLFTIAVNNRSLLSKASKRLPLLTKRHTPPVYIDDQTIEKEKVNLTKEILNYMNKSLDTDHKIKTEEMELEAQHLLKGGKKLKDIFKDRTKTKLNDNQLENHILELADLISFKLSGRVRPDFHYGLSEKITKDDYNLNESLDYLIKHQMKSYGNMNHFINHNSKFNMHKINQEKLENIHYSGWNYVVNNLYMQMHNPDGVMLNAFIDRTFHWEYNFNLKMGLIPYKEPWVGFLHHALDKDYSDYNCYQLFQKEAFRESLKYCHGIYVFSQYLKNWLQKTLCYYGYYHVRVENLIHPTANPKIKFNLYKFRQNHHKSIVQIGGWYRNSYAIYDLDTNLNKIALKGSGNNNYFKPKDFDFDQILELGSTKVPPSGPSGHQILGCGHLDESDPVKINYPYKNNKYMTGMVEMLKKKDQSVQILENIDNLSYDHLLSQNIVFLNLVDCSVSNTVIECIIRNTPILINPHPAVVELLGCRYPFYYNTMEEATQKSNDNHLIFVTHYYLRSLNKKIYDINYFIKSLKYSQIHQSIKLPYRIQKGNLFLEIQDPEDEDHDCELVPESPNSIYI